MIIIVKTKNEKFKKTFNQLISIRTKNWKNNIVFKHEHARDNWSSVLIIRKSNAYQQKCFVVATIYFIFVQIAK